MQHTPAHSVALFSLPIFSLELPEEHTVVTGIQARYRIGDLVDGNCSIKYSKPAANLTWTINGIVVSFGFGYSTFSYRRLWGATMSMPMAIETTSNRHSIRERCEPISIDGKPIFQLVMAPGSTFSLGHLIFPWTGLFKEVLQLFWLSTRILNHWLDS